MIADVAARAGHDLGVAAGPIASRQLFEAVPFYAGLTLDAIGGRGVRWPAHESAARFEVAPWEPADAEGPARGARAARREGRAAPRHLPLAVELQGGRRLAGAAVPAPAAGRRALAARRRAARRRRGRPRRARLQRHARARRRCACATRSRAARSSSPRARPTSRPTRSPTRSWRSTASAGRRPRPGAVAIQVAPAVEGLAEARPSAPLEIPPTGPGQSGHGA